MSEGLSRSSRVEAGPPRTDIPQNLEEPALSKLLRKYEDPSAAPDTKKEAEVRLRQLMERAAAEGAFAHSETPMPPALPPKEAAHEPVPARDRDVSLWKWLARPGNRHPWIR